MNDKCDKIIDELVVILDRVIFQSTSDAHIYLDLRAQELIKLKAKLELCSNHVNYEVRRKEILLRLLKIPKLSEKLYYRKRKTCVALSKQSFISITNDPFEEEDFFKNQLYILDSIRNANERQYIELEYELSSLYSSLAPEDQSFNLKNDSELCLGFECSMSSKYLRYLLALQEYQTDITNINTFLILMSGKNVHSYIYTTLPSYKLLSLIAHIFIVKKRGRSHESIFKLFRKPDNSIINYPGKKDNDLYLTYEDVYHSFKKNK